MLLKVIFSLIFINYIFCFDLNNNTVVKTTSGVIKGKAIKVLNQTINQFLGIPFAEPPIGKLRFSKPKPLQKPIERELDATVIGKSCMQGQIPDLNGFNENLNVSEDCLVLNIWSPQTPQNVSSKLKPVMFWIYGGGFIVGSIFQLPAYNGSILATHDVVFVSTNYRLGPFGFLYGGTDDAPGNLGFYDQLLAMKWVRENIHLFGGDKNQITIFGESAGSWSTSVHLLSPLSKGLFQRAIMESGAQFHGKLRGVSTKNESLSQAKYMAKHFNCSDDQKWLDCLRAIDAHNIMNYPNITSFPLDGTEFLPILAQNAFKQHSYNKDIDLIAGVTKNEGSLLALVNYEALRGNLTLKDFKEMISFSNLYFFHNINEEKVFDFYLKDIDTKNSSALRKAFFDFYGDILIKCPTYLFAKQFANNSPHKKTYFYELTYQSKDVKLMGFDEQTLGICHGSDLGYVFGLPMQLTMQNLSTQLDYNFSLDVMKIWSNFAKSGDPGYNWPQLIDHDTSVIKNLNPHDLNGVFVDPFKNVCDEFWNNYFE